MPRFWAMIRGDQFRIMRETGEQDTGFYVCRITEAPDEQAAVQRLHDAFMEELKSLPFTLTAESRVEIEEIETIPSGNEDYRETGFILVRDEAGADLEPDAEGRVLKR